MSTFLDEQQIIIDKIKDLGVAAQFAVFDGSMPESKDLKETNGRPWPYVVFGLGGKSQPANRYKGIGSSRDDIKWTAATFYCVGDTPATIRKLEDLIRNEFEGFIPAPGWGQMTEVLSGDYGISKPSSDLLPLRFGKTLVFTMMTDS